MKSIQLFIIVFFAGLVQNSLSAQALDEELGFIYVKAEYLLETGRNEEAVVQYNQVIAKNPTFKEALIHRGMAKFALGAYAGAKIDAVKAIELKGIEAASAFVLGRCFEAMGDSEAAINSLTAAIALDPNSGKAYFFRGKLIENAGKLIQACQDYQSALKAGYDEARFKVVNLCGGSNIAGNNTNRNDSQSNNNNSNNDTTQSNYKTEANPTQPQTNIPDEEPISQGTRLDPNSDSSLNGNQADNTNPNSQPQGNTDDTNHAMDDSEPVIADPNMPKNDDYINDFVIDEDLSIQIYAQELGRRKIDEVPSILILSDDNGKVTVNICVNKEGVVTKAEFNPALSTIAKKSLVSLAIRKSKEFEFSSGKYDLQCGFMVFKIRSTK